MSAPKVTTDERCVKITVGSGVFNYADRASYAEFVREATQALYAAWPVCDECRGSGDEMKDDYDERRVQCSACGGSGVKGGE